MPSYCCVVGCHSRAGRDLESVQLFSFPLLRNPVQAELWRHAVKRVHPDGTEWHPNRNTRLCSKHFVSGHYSRTRADPDYIHTIFPTKHIREKTEADRARSSRVNAAYFNGIFKAPITAHFFAINFHHHLFNSAAHMRQIL